MDAMTVLALLLIHFYYLLSLSSMKKMAINSGIQEY